MAEQPLTWWEIEVPDLEQGKAFYGGLFGWTFQAYGEMDGYATVFDADQQMIGGLMRSDAEQAAGRRIVVTFTVDALGDETLEQRLAKVRELGGTVVQERTEIPPDMGWYATVSDPAGLSFGLWTARPAADRAGPP